MAVFICVTEMPGTVARILPRLYDQDSGRPIGDIDLFGRERKTVFADLAEFEAAEKSGAHIDRFVEIAGDLYRFDPNNGLISQRPIDKYTDDRKTVAILGDSFVVRDIPGVTSGYIGITQKSIFEWTNIYLGKRLRPIYNGYDNTAGLTGYDGVSGTTITSFLTRIDGIIAKGADYVWVTGSVNNSGSNYVSVADRIAGYTTIIQKILKAGQIPIVTSEPTSTNLNSTAKYKDWIDFNKWLRTDARAMGALIADYQFDIADRNSLTGQPVVAYTDSSDGVHRSWRAAALAGKCAAASLDAFIPKWDIPFASVYDAAATGHRNSIVRNPIMIDANADTISDTWSVGASAGGTLVTSIVPRSDGIPGNWQQCVWTPSAAGQSLYISSSGGAWALGDKVIGDTIELFTELEIDDTNVGMLAGMWNLLMFTGASGPVSRSYQFTDYAGSGAGMLKGISGGVMSTPRTLVPSGTTGLSIQNMFYSAGSGSPVTIRIGRVGIF